MDIGIVAVVVVFCVFMDRDEVDVNKNAKKMRGQYPAVLAKQAWSIKV